MWRLTVTQAFGGSITNYYRTDWTARVRASTSPIIFRANREQTLDGATIELTDNGSVSDYGRRRLTITNTATNVEAELRTIAQRMLNQMSKARLPLDVTYVPHGRHWELLDTIEINDEDLFGPVYLQGIVISTSYSYENQTDGLRCTLGVVIKTGAANQ